MLDRFKTVGMLFAFWGASTGTASAFTPPQAVRKRHFEAYHSWQSRYCDST